MSPSDSLHENRPTERFSDRAGDYARFRPTYPAEAIDAVLSGLPAPARLTAADVGAGTGISSRLLADRGVRVVAVEPNAAMRAAAAPHPLVVWRDGTAEATGLPEASVDLILCAQAFHWFEPTAALAEFRRILAPGGRVALLWNERDESHEATAEFSRAIRAASNDDPAARRHVRPGTLFSSPRFRDARTLEFSHVQRLDADGLVGRAVSASYVPREGPALDRLVASLRAMPALYADADGLVPIVYATRLYLAERAG